MACDVYILEKRQDFLIRGRKENELQEKWGYVIENNTANLELVCSIGFQVGNISSMASYYSLAQTPMWLDSFASMFR